MEREDRVAGVVLAAQQAFEIEPIESGLDLRQLLGRLGGGLLTGLLGQLEVDLRVLELRYLLAPALERSGQRRAFAQDRLGLLPVAPEVRRRCGFVQLA
jgi:hypothetical protein